MISRKIFKINNSKIVNKAKIISELERIPFYEKGKGLPIGNLTSQILAIFYLNDLDHFIKEKLRIKYYIRYMDDGILLSTDREYLVCCLNKIKLELKKCSLKLNDKTKIINVTKEEIDFLGFRFYIRNNQVIMKVRNKTKKKMKKKLSNIKKEIIPDNKKRK